MDRIIYHELPRIGKVAIPLFGESLLVYETLEKDGLIDYLKKIKQLGFIHNTFPAQNHSRYDYCILQLYFIQLIGKNFPNIGIKSDMFNHNGNAVSTKVFLQIWVLISNIGHFPESSPSEKALVDSVKKRNLQTKIFHDSIYKYEFSKDILNEIFNSNNFYKIKLILAFDHLLNNKETKDLMASILLELSANSEKYSKINEKLIILNRIRRISYIFLDSINAEYPITFDVSKIIFNISNYPVLFDPRSREYDRFIENCEIELMKRIYISEKAIPHFQKVYQHNWNIFESFDFLIENKLSLLKQFRQTKSLKNSNQKLGKGILPLQIYLNFDELSLFGEPIAILKKVYFNNIDKYERNLNELIDASISKIIQVSLIFDQSRKFIFLNYIVSKKKINNTNIKIVLETFFRIAEKFRNDCEKNIEHSQEEKKLIKNVLFHDFNRKVILQSMKLVFKFETNLKVNLANITHMQNPVSRFSNSFAIVDKVSGTQTLKKSIEYCKKFMYSNFKEDQLNSINCLQCFVLNNIKPERNTNYYFSLGPIIITKVNESIKNLNDIDNPFEYKDVTDIDCLIVVISKSDFQFVIIEGKKSKSFKSDVKKDFQSLAKTSLLDIEANAIFDYIHSIEKKAKGGYLTLR